MKAREDIQYSVRKSKRARAMRVSVYADGAVIVSAPSWKSASSIRTFVAKYWSWITREVSKTRGRKVIYLSRADIPELKRRALALALSRLQHFASVYNVSYGKVSIGAQKARWGSCSHVGNLSFNYKLAALPPHIIDYVIIHELCHRLSFDHSKNFWAHVARTLPEHRAIRKELRETAFIFR